jgi:hypothetical protein
MKNHEKVAQSLTIFFSTSVSATGDKKKTVLKSIRGPFSSLLGPLPGTDNFLIMLPRVLRYEK